jgi:hypothetical protein
MRLTILLAVLVACGGSHARRPLGAPDDDLDLDGSMGRRAAAVEEAPPAEEAAGPPADPAYDLVV